MEIVARPDQWLVTDQENWARFLETDTGKRLLPTLADTAPLLLGEGDVNRILIRSGELRGYQSVMRELISLAHPQEKQTPEAVSNSYPNLEDDANWNDGQKLNPGPEPAAPTE